MEHRSSRPDRQKRPPVGAWAVKLVAALDGDHPRFGRGAAFAVQALIVISVLSIGIETLPGLPEWARDLLAIEEAVIVAAFTAEYLLRLLVAEQPARYARSFWGVTDLAAILPFYLSLGIDLRAFRALRLLRLFRLFKLARYSRAAERIGIALRSVREELVVFGLAAMALIYLCAIFIYHFEHDAQPDAFASVFHAMWWAAITLTTVGYGDVYPVTLGGRVFTVLMLMLALGIIAVPTGIVASALSKVRQQPESGPESRDASLAKPADEGVDHGQGTSGFSL
jgi:voltage-gated potassium channel